MTRGAPPRHITLPWACWPSSPNMTERVADQVADCRARLRWGIPENWRQQSPPSNFNAISLECRARVARQNLRGLCYLFCSSFLEGPRAALSLRLKDPNLQGKQGTMLQLHVASSAEFCMAQKEDEGHGGANWQVKLHACTPLALHHWCTCRACDWHMNTHPSQIRHRCQPKRPRATLRPHTQGLWTAPLRPLHT